MSKAKPAQQGPTEPRVEILTASDEGMRRFTDELSRQQRETGASQRGRSASWMGDGARPLVGAVFRLLGPLNRDLNRQRIEEYQQTMEQGRWWFTPDPVVVTTEGFVINGQHRLMAAAQADPREKGLAPTPTPQFVVVWGVDKRAALLMDEARRTANDRRDLAVRFAESTR